MELFKWADGIKPKFPKFVESLFGRRINEKVDKSENVSSIPAVNVESMNSKHCIEIAVPSLDKSDLKIQVEGNVLTVSSEKEYSQKDKGRNFLRQEFSYAAFSRSFSLPDGVDANAISAKLDKGILKLSIPSKGNTFNNVQPIKVN